MSHGQIRTPIAIKLLNSLDLAVRNDVVACPSLATTHEGAVNQLVQAAFNLYLKALHAGAGMHHAVN
jgi:hypothetical protein